MWPPARRWLIWVNAGATALESLVFTPFSVTYTSGVNTFTKPPGYTAFRRRGRGGGGGGGKSGSASFGVGGGGGGAGFDEVTLAEHIRHNRDDHHRCGRCCDDIGRLLVVRAAIPRSALRTGYGGGGGGGNWIGQPLRWLRRVGSAQWHYWRGGSSANGGNGINGASEATLTGGTPNSTSAAVSLYGGGNGASHSVNGSSSVHGGPGGGGRSSGGTDRTAGVSLDGAFTARPGTPAAGPTVPGTARGRRRHTHRGHVRHGHGRILRTLGGVLMARYALINGSAVVTVVEMSEEQAGRLDRVRGRAFAGGRLEVCGWSYAGGDVVAPEVVAHVPAEVTMRDRCASRCSPPRCRSAR